MILPKVWYLNLNPQYLHNYSSPTNDLYSVRKKSIRAFKLIFKLLGWGHWLRTLHQNFARVVSLTAFQRVSIHAMVTLTQSCPQWFKVATEENRKNEIFAQFFLVFWSRFFDFGDIKSRIRENACNAV